MRIIISPAKKMNINMDDLAHRDLPEFLPQTEILLAKLKEMSYDELKSLWKCSDKIAEQNYERLRNMDLRRQAGRRNGLHTEFSFKRIQHQHL